MLRERIAADKILEAVRSHPECTLDELILSLPGLSWSEVFLEVDRLSRLGHLRLDKSGSGFTTTFRAP